VSAVLFTENLVPSDAASKGWVLCADAAAKAGIISAPCRPTAPCLVIECAATGTAPSGKPRTWRSDPDHTTPACGTCVGLIKRRFAFGVRACSIFVVREFSARTVGQNLNRVTGLTSVRRKSSTMAG
jgi:hypothetical protein